MRPSSKSLILVLAAALLAPSLAFASGIEVPGAIREPFPEQDPMVVTQKLKCVVVNIEDDGTLLVEDDRGRHRIAYDADLKVFPQDKRQFDGRKKLSMDDIEVGHRIKVTVRPAAREIVSIQVLRERVAVPTRG